MASGYRKQLTYVSIGYSTRQKTDLLYFTVLQTLYTVIRLANRPSTHSEQTFFASCLLLLKMPRAQQCNAINKHCIYRCSPVTAIAIQIQTYYTCVLQQEFKPNLPCRQHEVTSKGRSKSEQCMHCSQSIERWATIQNSILSGVVYSCCAVLYHCYTTEQILWW